MATVAMATLLNFGVLKFLLKSLIFSVTKILKLASSDLHKMQMDMKACLRVIVSLFWKQNDRHITSLIPNRKVIISKKPYISLIIASRATKYVNYL